MAAPRTRGVEAVDSRSMLHTLVFAIVFVLLAMIADATGALDLR